MISATHKKDDGTIQLTIQIPNTEVVKARDEVIENLAKTIEIAGFRKGKAPKKLVEEKISEEKITEEVLKKLLPNFYLKAIQEHNIRPVLNPRIHVQKIEKDKDFEFVAETCEAPETKLSNYKEHIRNITAKSKIIIPGKKQEPPSLDEIIKALLESLEIKLPRMLVEHEADRTLAQTLDEIKRLGLSLEQYLNSTGKTAESLRDEYRKKAENDIKFEFALQKIAETEQITVEEKEIEEAIQQAKDEKEKEHLKQNRYLLAGILRQQKTLDFLKNL